MRDVFLITGNKDKLAEIQRILGYKVNHMALDLDELQGLDSEKIAEYKARQGFSDTQKAVIVWDQSIYLSALNGFPGPLIKWFYSTLGLEKICQIVHSLGDDGIEAESILTFYDGQELKHFRGSAKGRVPKTPLGDKGFGWDPIFIPEGSDLTYAQMEKENPLFHIHNQDVDELESFLKEKGYNLKSSE